MLNHMFHVLKWKTQFGSVVINEFISTCLVSLFQWVQKRFSALSISLLGTWKNKGAEVMSRRVGKYYQEHKRSAASTHLKGNCLVWFSSQKQVLPATIRRLNALFVSRHETMPGSNSFSNLWVVNLMKREKKSRCFIDLPLTVRSLWLKTIL